MHEQLEMLKKYPLLVPTTKEFTAYEGFIRAGSEEFAVALQVPSYPSLTGLSLRCSWRLGYILRGSEDDLENCIDSYSTLLEYLDMLQHLIESRLQSPAAVSLLCSGRRPPYEVYRRVFDELAGVGLENVADVSSTLDEVRLKAEDAAGREHLLELSRVAGNPPSYGVRADLPKQALAKLEPNLSLVRLYQIFKAQLVELQAFWEVMDELDRECWVIDPDVPLKSHTHRRIVVCSNVSIQVTVDPHNARLRPDVKFLGSEMAIQPMHKTLSETFEIIEFDPNYKILRKLNLCVHVAIIMLSFPNFQEIETLTPATTRIIDPLPPLPLVIDSAFKQLAGIPLLRSRKTALFSKDWSPRASIINNLLDTLGMTEFPSRPEVAADETQQLVRPGECCVCYMVRNEDGHLPSEACDNTRCGSHFHQVCLYQWLTTVPNTSTSFNRIYGQCPNCEWPISCQTVPVVSS